MNKDKNFDELFRGKFHDYEQAPPAYLLENILDKVANKRKRRMLVFWRVAGIAAAILLAFVAGWQINENSPETNNSQMSIVNINVQKVDNQQKSNQILVQNGHLDKVTSLVASSEIRIEAKKQTLESIHQVSSKGSSVQADDESLRLKPIRKLYRLLLTSDAISTKNIQIPKSKYEKSTLEDLSIDQQIIAQNKLAVLAEKSDKGKAGWSVGAQFAPAYSVNHSSHSSQYASNMVNSSSSPLVLDGGISFSYKRGRRLSLQSGVYYSGVGQNSGNSSRLSGGDAYFDGAALTSNTLVSISKNKMMMNSVAGVIQFNQIPYGIVLNASLDGNELTTASVASSVRLIQNFEYIEIPLYLRYTLIDSKFDVVMLGGLSTNLLVGNKVFAENNSGKSLVGKTQDMETMNYSGTFGFGVKYDLSKRISLNVEPRIKYYLNSLSSNSSVSYKPYSIGVFTGLSYEF